MDVLRMEVESMAKAHQHIANQMKTELEEPLTAYSGAWRERRRIVQGQCEKILKLKMQQTQQVNKVACLGGIEFEMRHVADYQSDRPEIAMSKIV